jgi:hypothetical protein
LLGRFYKNRLPALRTYSVKSEDSSIFLPNMLDFVPKLKM